MGHESRADRDTVLSALACVVAPSVGDQDFVRDFARIRGAPPLTRNARCPRDSGELAGTSRDGETRTRTGDTTIFSEPSPGVYGCRTPANRRFERDGIAALRRWFRSVSPAFGTPWRA